MNDLKKDKSLEVEYMTLYERDKENIQQGVEIGFEKAKLEQAKALRDILDDGVISKKIGLDLAIVQDLRKSIELEK